MPTSELKGPFGIAALAKSRGIAKQVLRRTAILEEVDGLSKSITNVADRMRTDAYVEEKKRLAGETFCSTSWCRHVARIDELLDKLHALKAEALK